MTAQQPRAKLARRRSILAGASAGPWALVSAAVLATAGAVYFEESLTLEHLRISAEDEGRDYFSYQFSDQANGGKSNVTPAPRQPLSWSCNLVRSFEHPYCGFGLQFDHANVGRGINLGEYDNVTLKLNYTGPGELLRINLKNSDPRYSRPGDYSSDKVHGANVPVREGVQSLQVNLSEFTVAEWWKDQLHASAELAQPQLDNVIALEVLTGADVRAGHHKLRLYEIVFERRLIASRNWYSAIALLWLLLIASLVLHQRRKIAKTWRDTLDSIPQMVWSVDSRGRLSFNQQWEEFTGVPIQLVKCDPLELIHPLDRDSAVSAWRTATEMRERFDLQLRIKHAYDDYRWVLARAGPAFDEFENIKGWYGSCTDVHDRVAAEQALSESVANERKHAVHLKWSSEHDALTSLPNRRAFQARLEASCLQAVESGSLVGLLLIDLDHFKHVNDAFGHPAGDIFLTKLSERLRSSVRGGDFVARIGGDEFAVILQGIPSRSELSATGGAILEQLRAPIRVEGRTLGAGASIGGALFPDDSAAADDLFKCADTAVYALKASGRGGTKLFHSYMLEEAKKAAGQLALARAAVRDERVLPHYQPKVDLQTGALIGFEALLRLGKAGETVQMPESLEEGFKDYELASSLGELMHRSVARDVSSWSQRGLQFRRVSINASPAEFLRDDYAERLLRILAEHGVAGTAIEVEVTEHVFLERGSHYVSRALSELKRAGVNIALDDFGTGYSSLSHLRDFPVDVVKIDMSFIQQMANNSEIAAIVAAVISLARSLKIDVLAEGIEQTEQMEFLRCLGCHFGQGYLFGAAVEASRVEQTLSCRSAAA